MYKIGDDDNHAGLVIPRIPHGSLLIRGSGMWATRIEASGADFPSDVPVVDFEDVDQNPTGYEISNLLISRNTVGTALRHRSLSIYQRLTNSTLCNLVLYAPIKVGTVESTYNTLEVAGALSTTFENLIVSGGASAMVLLESSHCVLNNIHQGWILPQGSHNALRIIGGGAHKLSEIRSEKIDRATLTIEQCQSVVIDNVFNEGKLTTYVLEISGKPNKLSQDIVISHLGIARPYQTPHDCATDNNIGVGPGAWVRRYGLYVNSYAKNIRVLSGTMYEWGTSLGNPIRIDGGAQNISIENMHFFNNIGEFPLDSGPSALLNIDPAATDVHISIIDGTTTYKKWERSVGTVGVLVPAVYDDTVGHVFAYSIMTTGAGGPIQRLVQGTRQPSPPLNEALPTVGRLLMLLGTGSGVSLATATGGNIKFALGHTDWPGLNNTTIQLVYDGEHWREIARSATP